jgi:hypothetical protein
MDVVGAAGDNVSQSAAAARDKLALCGAISKLV